jgi:PAS domain S-box-containing protein
MAAKKRAKTPAIDTMARPLALAEAVTALHERESRLAAILDTAADAIITIDQRGLIQSVNPASERMFGYAAKELIGRNVTVLMPAPYSREHDAYIASYLRTGVGKIIGIGREVTARRKDGSLIPVDLAVSEVDHLNMFTGIMRDLSERKRLEREIIEIATLEQQRLGANLHDDCGQELTALGLLAGGLVESLKAHSPADVEIARKIAERLKHMLQYVRDVAQGLVVKIDPSKLSNALQELTSRLSETSGVQCVFKGEGTGDLRNSDVATHLYHIAQEACTNALKHAKAKKVQVRLGSDNAAVILQIQDDGVGISGNGREGLGLKVMHNRASVIGATLTIERDKRHGTVLTCTLPKEHGHASR